jgi:hypothetical protein
VLAVGEQARLLRLPDQLPGKRPRLQPAPRVELTKLSHRLLDDPAASPHAAHKTPIAMDFAVLPPRRVAQVHALIQLNPHTKKMGMVGTTHRFGPACLPTS